MNAETLALDVIKAKAPFDNFLDHEHTFEHMRMQSQPVYTDRTMRETWERGGGISVEQNTVNDLHHILEHHHPEPLSKEITNRFKAIIEDAEKELGIT